MTITQIFFAIQEGLPRKWRRTRDLGRADAAIKARQEVKAAWVEAQVSRYG